VVQDFNFESMRGQIDPLCFHLGQGSSIISVRMGSRDMGTALGSITAIWKQFNPNQPIRYTFLDQRFAEMYDDVTRTGRIFTSFAVLAVIIACLGLFALSAFMAEQRLREIGIRKVLGATAAGITSMLSGKFLKLVLISIILASPIAWIIMNRWLRDFAYRIHISWWMFVLSGLIALLIAIGTISFQSIRAALVNPAGLLRSE
ncbi:MAG TPA: FtsX-like permease family protein, partial [Chitinophagaceae bacterium]|nr:FtsX-like permease family protein [Chitinophagaceae bacterium]